MLLIWIAAEWKPGNRTRAWPCGLYVLFAHGSSSSMPSVEAYRRRRLKTERPREFGTLIHALERHCFSELKMARDTDGMVTFSRDAMDQFCQANGLSLASMSDDSIAALIDAWYMQHRMTGGEPDLVAEDLISAGLERGSREDGHRGPPLRFRRS